MEVYAVNCPHCGGLITGIYSPVPSKKVRAVSAHWDTGPFPHTGLWVSSDKMQVEKMMTCPYCKKKLHVTFHLSEPY